MANAVRDPTPSHVHRWTRAEYEHIVNTGGFSASTRLELLDGEILDMSPQKSLHASTCDLVEAALRACPFDAAYLRTQKPLAIDATSEPEPDVAVVPGSPRDYVHHHPTTALHIVEVADSSLDYDRSRKARVYARNGVPDYWIINLRDLVLEVYRQPNADGYRSRDTLLAGDMASPLAARDCAVAVASLLP
ncbi:Uma2 family endonuclease [Thiohalocapsa sp. ML1]|uniref:Uma2 family endonuclease n=1 Tax=Thiohalocapsa sp. ML1 TaxID=1431688 RepID=UPI000732056D|nr:Uma2 family endonuclease [Thiohalocapsa sp. ML1]